VTDRPTSAGYLASGFRDVDGIGELATFLGCLQYLEELPTVQAYKQQALNRLELGDGMTVIDVGCGLGFDVARMAAAVGRTGRAVGVDPSAALLRTASTNSRVTLPNVAWVLGTGENLGLRAEVVDAVRVDRTLQHVADPRRVVEEMYRVLRPGGRIACAEPDWGTFVVTSGQREKTRQIADFWCDSFRSGWIGRRLTPLLRRAGFVDVDVTGHLLVAEGVDAIDKVFDVKTTAARVSASTGDTSFGQRWWDALCTDEWPMAGVTVFLATGRKPSGESAPDVALGQAVAGSASTD
jgi:SAM-dependent methyltransferase